MNGNTKGIVIAGEIMILEFETHTLSGTPDLYALQFNT